MLQRQARADCLYSHPEGKQKGLAGPCKFGRPSTPVPRPGEQREHSKKRVTVIARASSRWLGAESVLLLQKPQCSANPLLKSGPTVKA